MNEALAKSVKSQPPHISSLSAQHETGACQGDECEWDAAVP